MYQTLKKIVVYWIYLPLFNFPKMYLPNIFNLPNILALLNLPKIRRLSEIS